MRRRAIAALARKDVRALLPVWLATMTLVLAGGLIPGRGIDRAVIVLSYALGSFAIGALAIGHEYVHGTLASSLAQPMSRRTVLAIKVAVVLPLLTAIAAAMVLVGGSQLRDSSNAVVLDRLLLVGLLSLFVAPALTMLTRNVLAGIVFTLAVPAAVWLAGDLIGLWIYGRRRWAAIDAFRLSIFWPVAYGICGAGAVATWTLFARLEAIDGGGQHLQVGGRRTREAQTSVSRTHPVIALIGKEVRIQQMALVVSALYVAGMLVQALLVRLDPSMPAVAVLPMTTLHAGAVAMLIGSMASAEERQLGTWQSQLLMPMAVWQQWIIKAGVAVTLVLLLGIVLPAVLAYLLPALSGGSVSAGLGAILLVLLTSLSLYVSSLTRSGIRALMILVVVAFGWAVFLRWLIRAVDVVASAFNGWPPGTIGGGRELEIVIAGYVSAITLLLVLGYRNHRAGERTVRTILGQSACLVALAVLISVAMVL